MQEYEIHQNYQEALDHYQGGTGRLQRGQLTVWYQYQPLKPRTAAARTHWIRSQARQRHQLPFEYQG